MKKLLIYRTKLGASKQYMEWLQEEIGGEIKTFDQKDEVNWDDYDMVVVASGTYAARMPLTKFLKKNWKVLKDKKVVAVAAGMAPADVGYSKMSYKFIPRRIRKKIKYFKLPGKMSVDKRKAEERETNNVPEVKKENLSEVIKFIKNETN